MCGRFRLSRKYREIREYFDISEDPGWEPRYNIAPTDSVLAVRQRLDAPGRTLSTMRWGLIPYWSKDSKGSARMINARSEEIANKPAYREAFRQRRCLIPADGFYEWKRVGKAKQAFHFGMSDDSLFAFAGIWERWKNPAGEKIESCSILTTSPNKLLADIHDRMPVIMPPDTYDLWLDPAFENTGELSQVLRPFNPSLMRRYPVSSRVNSVKNDDVKCLDEVLCSIDYQKEIFPPK